MNITSAVLVGFMTLDFMTAYPAAPVNEPKTTSVEVGQGELLVSISSSPLMGSVPRGATRLELAKINLSASCDSDVTVQSMSVKHTGLGNSSDISGVYLVGDYRRISRSRRFDSNSHIADLRIPQFVIPKCSARRLQVLADISSDADVASEHGITIDAPGDIQSSAKQTTLMYGDTSQKVVASPQQSGNITVNFLPVNGRFSYGRTETVARVQLTADGKNDHLLKSITFTNRADARDMNLINFRLETRSGIVLTPIAQRMRGLRVTLEFDPTYILERNQIVVFLLKAQINASQSKKIDFFLEEQSDLESVLYRPR